MDHRDRKARSILFGLEFGSGQVVVRLAIRLGILCLFALASRQPFWPVLTALFAAAAGLCLVLATLRREPVLGPALTHWDEAAIYAVLSYVADSKVAASVL